LNRLFGYKNRSLRYVLQGSEVLKVLR